MFVFTNFISAIAEVLHIALTLYMYLIIARAILSWLNPDPYNQIIQFIYRVTDPPLVWLRRTMPTIVGGFDLSPIIIIFAIIFLDHFIVDTLRQLAAI
ncbi:YggT family protein [candidate division KSB1 bacterium]|nr:YggT family protein [candidate division KSB1 bacterium]